ncbi:MAG: ArsR/SmtB family transcription factor [Chloroflexota bacterium]
MVNDDQSETTASAQFAETCEVKGADPGRVNEGRNGLLAQDAYTNLAEIFRALADPSRAKIVHLLFLQDLCTCDLAAITCLSEPAVSQHLRLLRMLKLVKTRREGKKVFYSLADSHVRFLLSASLQHLAHETIEAGVERQRPQILINQQRD